MSKSTPTTRAERETWLNIHHDLPILDDSVTICRLIADVNRLEDGNERLRAVNAALVAALEAVGKCTLYGPADAARAKINAALALSGGGA